jgi:large subunit ribosomal protein L18
MEAAKRRILARKRNKAHVRKRVSGTDRRPRVSVFRTAKHIYGQVIDDVSNTTLCYASSLEKELKGKIDGYTGNIGAAKLVGKALGDKLMADGVKEVVFDRNGFLYHGRVKSFAEGIREAGVKF